MKIMKDLLQNEYFMYQMFYIKNINLDIQTYIF
jgi:hypothetical protein